MIHCINDELVQPLQIVIIITGRCVGKAIRADELLMFDHPLRRFQMKAEIGTVIFLKSHEKHHAQQKTDEQTIGDKRFFGLYAFLLHVHKKIRVHINPDLYESKQTKLKFEFISYSFYGFDVIITQLFAQFANVHIDGAIAYHHFFTPDLIENKFAGEYFAGF